MFTLLSKLFLKTYKLLLSVKSKAFSLLISGAFAEFGKRSALAMPIRLEGENGIAIGNGVYIATGAWLQTLPECREAVSD